MRNFIKKFFSSAQDSPPDLLALQSENQRLHLALDETKSRCSHLEEDLARQGSAGEALRAAAIEKILTDLADPAAQFMLQLDLTDRQGKSIQAGDALAVARSLLKTLAAYGLIPADIAGETVPFDPAQHTLLSGGDLPPGQPVLIRVPGFSYQGRRLRKAGVSRVEG